MRRRYAARLRRALIPCLLSHAEGEVENIDGQLSHHVVTSFVLERELYGNGEVDAIQFKGVLLCNSVSVAVEEP